MVELGRLLTGAGVPDKQDILRVKRLIRELTPDDKAGEERVRSFVSAYFDIYLGRVTGERSLEREGLRRCLAELASSGHASPGP